MRERLRASIPRACSSRNSKCSGPQVGIALSLLQARDLGDAGGHEARLLDELLAPQIAAAQRDLAHLEAHAFELQLFDDRLVRIAVLVLLALHEVVDAGGVRHP